MKKSFVDILIGLDDEFTDEYAIEWTDENGLIWTFKTDCWIPALMINEGWESNVVHVSLSKSFILIYVWSWINPCILFFILLLLLSVLKSSFQFINFILWTFHIIFLFLFQNTSLCFPTYQLFNIRPSIAVLKIRVPKKKNFSFFSHPLWPSKNYPSRCNVILPFISAYYVVLLLKHRWREY